MLTLDDLLARIDESRDETVSLLQALVRVPSVNTGVMPTGNETPACEVLRDKLAADGIAAEIMESAPNRGNLVARWRGSGEAPSLMLMGHVDVVPVEDESQWTHPPFSAEVADGRVWGRGSDFADVCDRVRLDLPIMRTRPGQLRRPQSAESFRLESVRPHDPLPRNGG